MKPAQRNKPKSDGLSIAALKALAKDESPKRWPIQAPALMRGVVPEGKKAAVAMDASAYEYAATMYTYGDVGGFPGYPYLAMLALRAEYRNMASSLATEMTREWITLNSSETAGEATKKKVTELTQEMERLRIQQTIRLAVEQDAFYGSGQILVDLEDQDVTTPLVLDRRTIKIGSLQSFKVVEPIWTTPLIYNALDPSKPDFYKPSRWWVMGKEWHASRMLIIVTRWVPDILKPAFNFSGISLSQLAEPYVNNWLRARQSVSDLINNFSIIVLKTAMEQVLEGTDDGSDLFSRIKLFTATRSNKGVMALDKDREEIEQISVPISGLSELQAQAQEQMASCVVGNTLIETERGSVEIQHLTTRDKVLTRSGFAPIDSIGITRYTDVLAEIKTEAGTLCATPDHLIYLSSTKEFVPAKNVKVSDLLAGVPSRKRGIIPSFGVDTGMGRREAVTIAMSEQEDCSIVRFGKRIAAQYRKVASYITSMVTRQTISYPIWNLLPVLGTIGFISEPDKSLIAKNAPAASVAINSMLPVGVRLAIARPLAALLHRVRGILNIGNSRISAVENAMPENHKTLNIVSVTIKALRKATGESERVPVYDLKVRDGYLPEFYANGILVHNCARMPIVMMTGIAPAGLNTSSEGEIRLWYDWIAAQQEAYYRQPIDTILKIIQLSKYGAIDPDITFSFNPLYQMSEKELAEIRVNDSVRAGNYIDRGVLDAQEERERLARDPESGYQGIDVTKEIAPPAEAELESSLARGTA